MREGSVGFLQASATKYVWTTLFWVITQRVVVISHRRLGTAYRYHLQGPSIQKLLDTLPPKMKPIGYLETSVRNYHYLLRNDPEERCSISFWIIGAWRWNQ